MPLPLSTNAKNILINSISRDVWAPLDYGLFESITGQAGRRAGIIVRLILGVPDDCDSKLIEYGRTYVHDAPDFGCRVARCYYRHKDAAGPRFWWRRFALDVSDEAIVADASGALDSVAHLYRASARDTVPAQQPLIMPAQAPASADHTNLSDTDLRSAIDRARQHLHELELAAATRIAEHERTIAMLRGR